MCVIHLLSSCRVEAILRSPIRDMQVIDLSRCRNVQMLSYYMEMLRCRDVERGQECWPRTLTDLLQAHENGGQRSQNGEKGLNSISSLKLPFL